MKAAVNLPFALGPALMLTMITWQWADADQLRGSFDMDLWSESWGSVSAAWQLEVRVITLHYTQTVYCKLSHSKLKPCVVTAELQTGCNEMQ